MCFSAAVKIVSDGKFETDINWKNVLSSEITDRGRHSVMQVAAASETEKESEREG